MKRLNKGELKMNNKRIARELSRVLLSIVQTGFAVWGLIAWL